jgi:hypothetical protein
MPPGITTVILTGRYIRPDGTPLRGSVDIEAPASLTLSGADTVAVGAATMVLDENGAFSVALIATDNANMQPTGWAYEVTERFQHATGRSYAIQLPSTTPVVDIADIAPADPAQGDYVNVPGPAGTPGSQILSGTGAPSSGLASAGDYYLDTTTGAVKLYGPKAAGAWPAPVSLTSSVTAPVTSVNTKTGDVVLTPADTGALALTGGTLTGALTGTSVTTSGTSTFGNVRVGASASFGGGSGGIVAIQNATTAPTTNPTGGAVVYAESGLLKVRQADGTVNVVGAGVPVTALRTITATTVTAAAYDLLLCDATSNAITVTLPTATAGVVVTVKKTDASANAITISATVEGTTNPALTAQYQTLHLVGTGSAWVRITRPAMSAIVDYPTVTDARYLALAGGTVTGAVTSVRPASTDTVLTAGATGDAFDRARMLTSGRYEVGSGAAARDTAWYRQGTALWGTDADVAIRTAGKGLQIKEGTNARSGVVTLVAGTATVANTSVTATSRIQLTSQSDGGTPGWLRVSARTSGASFTITSSSASDTSSVAYFIVEPAA